MGSRPSISSFGFKLIELLVVIFIIALLIGILLPALEAARETARTTKCSANLSQWAIAMYSYAIDRKGKFPQNQTQSSLVSLKCSGVLHATGVEAGVWELRRGNLLLPVG